MAPSPFPFLLFLLAPVSLQPLVPKCCPYDQRLNPETLECVPSSETFPLRSVSRPSCDYRFLQKVPREDSERYVLRKDGSFVLRTFSRKNTTQETVFSPDEFCEDSLVGSGSVFLVCPCERVPCIRKCCSPNQVFNLTTERCQDSVNSSWVPPVKDDLSYELLISQNPVCFDSNFYMIERGAVWKLHSERQFLKDWWGYPSGYSFEDWLSCGDVGVADAKESVEMVAHCYGSFIRWENVVTVAVYVSASALILVSLLVHAVLPELRASIHGKALVCHCVCLLCAFVTLACNALDRPILSFAQCYSKAFVVLLSFLGASFWLNVLCINMSMGFRKPHSRRKGDRLFILYSIYAWGIPLLMTAITAVMYSLPGIPDMFVPTLSWTRTCWWETRIERIATFIYFYGPQCILLFINFATFFFTAARIHILQRNTSILRRNDSSNDSSAPNRSALLYVKLLWLTGVMEMVVELSSWAVHNAYFYFFGMEAVDVARALSVFVLSCCKRRVWKLLDKRVRVWGLLLKKSTDHKVSVETSSTSASKSSTRV